MPKPGETLRPAHLTSVCATLLIVTDIVSIELSSQFSD
jgi:hypothetical protein